MKEKDYYTKLGHFYTKRALEMKRTIVWEAKITKTARLSYRSLAPHQEEKLLESERAFNHKIPDVGNLKKPFDGVAIYGAYSVVVVIYYKPKNTKLYEIPIRSFIALRENSPDKSLAEWEASSIGTFIII